MKVLHLITELELGGAERLLVATLPLLDRNRFDVSVAFLYGDAPLRAELENAGIRVTKLDSRSKLDCAAFSRLVQLLRDERIDLLHTHLIQADLMGFFAARRAGVPLIVSTKHNTHYFQSHGTWLPRLDAFVNRRLTRIIAVSGAVRSFYLRTQTLDPDRFEVIHNGIDLEQFRRADPIDTAVLGLQPNDRIVCTVGSLTEKKGHAVLLQAWVDVVKSEPSARLLLIGDGPRRHELEQTVEHLGLKSSVRFLGRRHDVAQILRATELFVLPSLWEGFGIAVVEAMAAGTPVIASSVDGVCEVIRENKDGLLVPPGNPVILGEAMIELLKNPARATELARSASARADQFSITDAATRLQSLYETLTPTLVR